MSCCRWRGCWGYRCCGSSCAGGPVVTSIIPTSGPLAGGGQVTLSGRCLKGATVTFGGKPATVVSSGSNTVLIVTVPAGDAAGAVDVVVTTLQGSTTSTGGYSYLQPPTLTLIDPPNGPGSGGNTVVLTGTGFVLDSINGGSAMAHKTSVKVGTTTLADGDYTVDSATKITVTNWPAGTGAVDVTVTTDGGTSTAASYTYGATPTITTIDPASGPIAGGGTVVITGTNIDDTSTVTINGTVVDSADITIDTVGQTITVNPWPAGAAGAVDVLVTTTGGGASTAGTYTYHDAPTIVTLNPATGPEVGGNSVEITGTNFVAD